MPPKITDRADVALDAEPLADEIADEPRDHGLEQQDHRGPARLDVALAPELQRERECAAHNSGDDRRDDDLAGHVTEAARSSTTGTAHTASTAICAAVSATGSNRCENDAAEEDPHREHDRAAERERVAGADVERRAGEQEQPDGRDRDRDDHAAIRRAGGSRPPRSSA